MANIRFGSKQLERAFAKFSKDIIREAKKIVAETAYMIKNQAQALAPVDQGALRESIEVEFRDNGLTAIVSVGADYAVWVEYGTGVYATEGNGRKTSWSYYSEKLGRFVTTKGNRPQPFWLPAVNAGERFFSKEVDRLGG